MDCRSLDEIEAMTLSEYLLRMKAHRLRRVDVELDMHRTAWLHHQAGAKRLQGKKTVPVYKTFKDFFDYDKAIASVEGRKTSSLSDKHRRMAQLAAQANK